MKHTHLLIIALALILVGCKDKKESEITNGGSYVLPGNGGNSGDNGGTSSAPSVDFEFKRIAPLMVEFTNKSTGCKSYKWDFGDGTWSEGKDATHEFEQTGYDYPVTLTATTNDGNKISKRYIIELTTPEVYITGFTMYAIPYENKYYKIYVEDSSFAFYETQFTTHYTPLLASSDLPHYEPLYNPKKLVNYEKYSYYKVLVYYASNANDNGTKCLTIKMNIDDILQYPPELRYETSSTGATKVGITFGYDY